MKNDLNSLELKIKKRKVNKDQNKFLIMSPEEVQVIINAKLKLLLEEE